MSEEFCVQFLNPFLASKQTEPLSNTHYALQFTLDISMYYIL